MLENKPQIMNMLYPPAEVRGPDGDAADRCEFEFHHQERIYAE